MAPGLSLIGKQPPVGNLTPRPDTGEKASYWCLFLATSGNVFQKQKKL